MLVGLLANLISKNQWAYLIAPILVLFRSALNIFYEIHKLCVANEPVLKSLLERQEWTDTTPYDVWGLWSINVYPNQRHLMLGVSVLLILVIFFMPYIKEMFQSLRKKKWKEKIKSFLFSKEAWIEKSEDHRIFLAWCFAFMLPYFHGSALIACLLVLCMFAIFSKNRLSYLVFAIIAIISSVLQTSLFSAGASNVVNFQWRLGFVVEEVTFPEIMNYCFIITGIAFILAFLYVLMKWKDRIPVVLLISFLVPFIFTFLVKITTEITANHKFIQFSIILMDTLIAGFMADLFVRKESLDV